MKMSEWRYLCELLQHGYPLLEALTLLDANTQQIQQGVEEGNDVFAMLLPTKETGFSSHLTFFMAMMSFPHAIESALALSDFEHGLQQKLIKKSAYPILIFLIAYGMLWFFTSAIIPQMMTSFESDADFQSLSFIITTIQWFCTFVGLVLLLMLFLAIYLHLHRDVRVALLYKFPHVPLLHDYVSYMFAGYLVQMELHGVSTKSCMQFFQRLKNKSVLQEVTTRMRKQLEAGISLQALIAENDMLNKAFILSFKVGSAANSLTTTLRGFMKQQEVLWDGNIKKFSILLQCVSYSFVGLAVVLVYQIMLIPLQMLEQM